MIHWLVKEILLWAEKRTKYMIDLDISESRSRLRLKVITFSYGHRPIDLYVLGFVSNTAMVPGLWPFEKMTFKIRGQGHG